MCFSNRTSVIQPVAYLYVDRINPPIGMMGSMLKINYKEIGS